MVTLDPVTRRDAASGFFGEDNVPHQALTMGVGTILESKRIVLLAFGEHKAPIVQRAVEGEMTETITASSPRSLGPSQRASTTDETKPRPRLAA